MQETLDAYGAGVLINVVQLQAVQPPSEVQQAFFDVNAAQQDAVRVQNEAETFASRVVPEARGEAARTVQQAEGYREQSVADATGQAARFRQVYEEYRKAPAISRERIFLETMERVYGGDGQDHHRPERRRASCPILPLNEMQRRLRPRPEPPTAAGSHAMNNSDSSHRPPGPARPDRDRALQLDLHRAADPVCAGAALRCRAGRDHGDRV